MLVVLLQVTKKGVTMEHLDEFSKARGNHRRHGKCEDRDMLTRILSGQAVCVATVYRLRRAQ